MKLVVKKNRFRATHQDEMGSYGFYADEFAVTEETGDFICWVDELEAFLLTPMAKLIDVKPMQKIIDKCRQEG